MRWIRLRLLKSRLRRLAAPSPMLTAMVTGSSGKTTTTNMLARILADAGRRVGKCTTEGIFIEGRNVWEGDASGYKGAAWVTTEPGLNAAVLETARGDILKRGLWLENVDVAALTNIGREHLGEYGVDTPDQMARVKKAVLDAARRAVVINADDVHCMRIASAYPVDRTILFSSDARSEAIRTHLERGGRAIATAMPGAREAILFLQGEQIREIVAIGDLPAARGGKLRSGILNAMTAAGLAAGLGLTTEEIARGLRNFRLDRADSPARFMLLGGYAPKILVDFCVHPVALENTLRRFSIFRSRAGATVS